MSIQEIKEEIEMLAAKDRRQLTVYLVPSSNREPCGMPGANGGDEDNLENWLMLEELDRWFEL